MQTLIGSIVPTSTLAIRIDDDLKRTALGVADHYGFDLSSASARFLQANDAYLPHPADVCV